MDRSSQQSNQVVVAIESWTINDSSGNPVFVHQGSRWRSDDPIVKRRPELFIEDGATTGEVLRARERAGIHRGY